MGNARSLNRQEKIMEVLAHQDSATVKELATVLDVSGWTVRRELDKLEERRLIQRYHGGAALLEATTRASFLRSNSFEQNVQENLEAKRRIGRAAAGLVQADQQIAIGAGTTTTQVARVLKQRKHLFIMTNALNIALELSTVPDLKVMCTGGDVDGTNYTLTGPIAERVLRSHFFDVAIIGVGGISIKEGLTSGSQLNVVTSEIMIEHARRVIVVADQSKIGQVRFAHLSPLSRVDVLVTDQLPPPSFCETLAQMHVELVIADVAYLA